MRIPFRRRPWLRAGLPPLIVLACVLGQFAQADAAQQGSQRSHQRITERHACARPDKAGYAACFASERVAGKPACCGWRRDQPLARF